MKSHYRVVVIGGGIVGASVLYHLTRYGWSDVALIERAELTSGSTWHAAAGFHALNDDPNIAALQGYTIRLYDEIEKESGQSVGMHMTGGISLAEVRSRSRRFKKEHGLALIIVDYLQLMTASANRRPESREREIAEISSGLKNLAKELQVPVFALAQLNREADKRIDKRPKISDLRESGSIEMDADVILFVYRDDYYDRNSEDSGKAEIIFGKNRHGGLDTVPLAYQPSFVSFYNLLKG